MAALRSDLGPVEMALYGFRVKSSIELPHWREWRKAIDVLMALKSQGDFGDKMALGMAALEVQEKYKRAVEESLLQNEAEEYRLLAKYNMDALSDWAA